jgi:hypothetical protein
LALSVAVRTWQAVAIGRVAAVATAIGACAILATIVVVVEVIFVHG